MVPDALSLRVGRFEPAYHAISSKRSYYILQPYEIYTCSTPAGGFVFDDNQFGLEATGHSSIGLHYGLGIVNGTGPRPDNNKSKDIYLTLHQVLGRGDGQSAGQRVGVFGYMGWQPTQQGMTTAPTGENDGDGDKKLYRIGGDVSLNWQTFNFRGLLLYGVDNKGFNVFPIDEDYKYSGGFVEFDYAALPNNRLLFSALFNWVEPRSQYYGIRVRTFSGLVRYYLGDWTAVNVSLHAEYTHKQLGEVNPDKGDIFTLLVDFAF